MKFFLIITILFSLLIGGCAPSSTAVLREAQNNEIAMLQDVKRQILLRPANTPKEKLAKKGDLKMVDDQIASSMKVQQNAQNIQNQKTNNTIKSVVTGVGAVGAATWGIHELTK
ncbi:hypothetical protein H3N56_03005 [Cetobacterium sp. 2A]|uniref:hypothetical protein n=1 Tax=Cetobacterium sp. 2A TaxID=2754723 RepID=UPI00163B97E7|nr:hypothetical protein [Cetobacterium sp. 2A]MBC2855463.1 hypothetical protein [Cetobacterium sp. 2A]